MSHCYLFEVPHLADALFACRALAPACGTEHEVEVVVHVTVDEQLKVLEDDADSLAQGGNLSALDAAHVVAQHLGRAVAMSSSPYMVFMRLLLPEPTGPMR